MSVFDTQMQIVTFIFVSIEIVIFFYLVIFRLSRPNDNITFLNIILILLLLIYNITGGLLPDPKLPGSFFTQEVIAYATGFITPCYFPYYVYKAFGLEKMKFHVQKGVYLFLILPYVLFALTFAATDDLKKAQNLLILPVLYAIGVIISLVRAIKYKYKDNFGSKESKQELVVLFLSLTPWVGLPIITYLNFGQTAEATITNVGFLLLFGLQVYRNVQQLRKENRRLNESEQHLLNWNTNLQEEVNKRTKELERLNEQKTNNFINLVHETKTPLTLVRNYLDEYINKYGSAEELNIIKGGVDKLTTDVTNLFDIERFTKGIDVYQNNQVSDFSSILTSSLSLFEYYFKNQEIECLKSIEADLFIKSDPNGINRIVNNVIENAIKFSSGDNSIEISLVGVVDKIIFTITDMGMGIPLEQQSKIFEPYYQINHKTTNLQGMGLGLPIVKRVVENLGGTICIESDPAKGPGTKVIITLNRYLLQKEDSPVRASADLKSSIYGIEDYEIVESVYNPERKTILLVEDNKSMIQFLFNKLNTKFNIYCSLNGADALKKLQNLPIIPNLIISDIMMDKMDGFVFVKVISKQSRYNHIPIIFLTAKSTLKDRLKGLKLGATGFISKPFSYEELSQKIETVLNNILKQQKAILNSSIANLNALQSQGADDSRSSGLSKFEENCKLLHFTAREIEVAHLIIKGRTYKMIAKELFISEKTVTKHIQNLFEKAEVKNKIQLLNMLDK